MASRTAGAGASEIKSTNLRSHLCAKAWSFSVGLFAPTPACGWLSLKAARGCQVPFEARAGSSPSNPGPLGPLLPSVGQRVLKERVFPGALCCKAAAVDANGTTGPPGSRPRTPPRARWGRR